MRVRNKIAMCAAAATATALIFGLGSAAFADSTPTTGTTQQQVAANTDTSAPSQGATSVASPDSASSTSTTSASAAPTATSTEAATPSTAASAPSDPASQAAAPVAPVAKAAPAPVETKAPAPAPSTPVKSTTPVTSGHHAPGGGSDYSKVCTTSDVNVVSANYDFTTATVALKPYSKVASCDVELQSFHAEGTTWQTSGTQQWVTWAHVTLTHSAPKAKLSVAKYCQQDLSIGSLKNDGVEAPLPHYPDSDVPLNSLGSYIGGPDCAPIHHNVPASGTATKTDTYCSADYKPVDNTLVITPGDKSKAVIAVGDNPLYKAIDAGTFNVSDLGAFTYPLTVHVKFVGEGSDETTPIDLTFSQPKSASDCFTAATSTIEAVCTTSGAQVHAVLNAGTVDTTFDLFINREQAVEKTVAANTSYDLYYGVPEDSNGGTATATVKVGGGSVSDVILFTTNCNPTIIATPTAPTSTATCTTDGTLPQAPQTDTYSSAYDRKYNGPGDYLLTFTGKQGNEFSTGKTVTLTVHVPAKVKDAKACPTSTPTPGHTPSPTPAPHVNTAGTPPTTGTLAFTGSNPLPLVGLMALLFGIGIPMTAWAKRRRNTSTEAE